MNNIKFGSSNYDGRVHWQQVLQEGISIGWVEEKEQGFLMPIETYYYRNIKETSVGVLQDKVSFDTVPSEFKGVVIGKFTSLEDLVLIANKDKEVA